jgi:hypothetical protein
MQTLIFKGSKQEIAEGLARITGEVLEAIVFVNEAVPLPSEPGMASAEDIFAEMKPFMVEATDVDDSREAIYTLTEGEVGELP